MKKLSIREARQSLSRLERLLEGEEEVTITRRGEAIARLIRIGERRPIPFHRDLRQKMPKMKQRSEKLIRKDRNRR